jgi:hypothetical protein
MTFLVRVHFENVIEPRETLNARGRFVEFRAFRPRPVGFFA